METSQLQGGKEAIRNQEIQGILEERIPMAATTVEEMDTLPGIAASPRKDARRESERCRMEYRME